jgi:hypothetical protein
MSQGRNAVRDIWKKFLESWRATTAVTGVIGATVYLGATEGVSLVNAIKAGLTNLDKLGVTLAAVNTGLLTTVSMFALARWSALRDRNEDHLRAIEDAKSEIKLVKEQNAHLYVSLKAMIEGNLTLQEQIKSFSASLAELRSTLWNQSDPMVDEDDAIWAGLVHRLITQNPTFARDVTIHSVAGGRYRISVEPNRVYGNFVARLVQPGMQLTYIVYVPKELGFGENPGEVLLKLVHIIRCARSYAEKTNNKINAKINVFLVDRPRPIGSVFLSYREVNGRLEDYVLEYFRSLARGAIGSPTSQRGLLRHTSDRRIRELYDYVESEVKTAVEIGYETVERIIRPLLPEKDGGVAPVVSSDAWRAIIHQLYDLGDGRTTEFVQTGSVDFRIDEQNPSIYWTRRNDTEASVEPCFEPAPTAAEGS